MDRRVKLFLVGRSDLSAPGFRAAQICHALRQFGDEHPAVDKLWFETSNTLVLLEVPDEQALLSLADEAKANGLPTSLFREPDIGYAPTALALGPGARHLVRHLPLAFG